MATPRFRQPFNKYLAGLFYFGLQKYLPVSLEIWLCRVPIFYQIAERLRDAISIESLKVIYFPIPKSGCTYVGTQLILNSNLYAKFNPVEQGVHQFRYNNIEVRLNNFNKLVRADYYRFTIIRDPFTRILSAYLDKMVKPISKGESWATPALCGKYSFEDVVNEICCLPDAAIEKHFRPQHTFFRNVKLEYIGTFDQIESCSRNVFNTLGIEIDATSDLPIKSPKRTNYSSNTDFDYVGNKKAMDFEPGQKFPAPNHFYNKALFNKVKKRYIEDYNIFLRSGGQFPKSLEKFL